ncbi:hypothetical protein FHS83_002623 [Rhizomicrobium palustre]|uniref:Uncharacterized protein n=1 Tax=Rhizomicrobium palustre TaxID=189966 RepID=A0A846N1G1_9PROT|nr:hypothetical protein [Rhizomicrobium palustre]
MTEGCGTHYPRLALKNSFKIIPAATGSPARAISGW